MVLGILLLAGFSAAIIMQLYRINQIVVQEKKTTGVYIAMILGTAMILGVSFYFGEHWSRFPIGMLGAGVLACSLYETGLTQDSFLHSTPSQRIISRRSRFVEASNVRVEVLHKDKVVVRFIHKRSEHFMVFPKEEEETIKNLLSHHITELVTE